MAATPGCMSARIEIGTKTSGRSSIVVPLKPRGATPTIVIDWPLTTSGVREHVRAAGEPVLPEGVAQHRDASFPFDAIVVGADEPSERGLDAERGEVAARHGQRRRR